MTKRAFWPALSALLCLTFSPSPSIGAYPLPIHSAPVYSANDVIVEINALRASNGLPAYEEDATLMQIAQAHSDYQASIGTVTHFSADGSRPFQRALAAGYPLAGDLSAGGFFSENIDAGNNLSPAGVVRAWMGDSIHQATMLSPNLTDVGAGVAVAEGITYYTLDAGASKNSAVSTPQPAGGSTPIPGTAGTLGLTTPVVTSTPKEDGSISHEVQPGEALWSIALAYGISVDELKRLNGLDTNDIYEGQVLLIRRRAGTQTATPEAPTATVTIGVPVSTSTARPTTRATFTTTPVPAPPATRQGSGLMAGIILTAALLAAGVGTWLGTKKHR